MISEIMATNVQDPLQLEEENVESTVPKKKKKDKNKTIPIRR